MKPRSIRFNEEDLKELDRLGVDLSELIRSTIKKIINSHDCPVCGQKVRSKNEGKRK